MKILKAYRRKHFITKYVEFDGELYVLHENY